MDKSEDGYEGIGTAETQGETENRGKNLVMQRW